MMKRITTFLLILPALILAITSAAAADDDSRNRGYGFLMLEEPVNPRSAAMGSAGTALGSGGFYYYNPAQPFFAAGSYASAEFGQIPGGLNRGGFETALIAGEWFSAAGFHSSSVDFETRDERGLGAKASSSTTIGSVSAGHIRGRLALAVSASIINDRIWAAEGDYSAFSFSAGAGYKMLDGKLNLGAAGFHGIAWSRGYGDSASALIWRDGKVPRFARAGAAWTDTLKSLPYTITADVAYSDEDGTFSVPAGIEVSVLPYVDLRIGKRIGWENEIMSFGIGFNIDRISFDATFIPTVFVDDYEMKWCMGFKYSMGRIRKKDMAMDPLRIGPVDLDSIDDELTDKPEGSESTESAEDSDSTDESEPAEPNDDSGSTESADDAAPESTDKSESTEPADKSVPTESSDKSD